MLVRAKKTAARHKGETPKLMAQRHTFPAPINGLVLTGNPASPPPMSATRLDNWICTTDGIRARGGSTKHASIGDPATSLFTYRSGGTETLFCASETDIYDVTAPADVDVAPTADVTGQTSGIYSTHQFSTTGGEYLFCANGTDDIQRYDGSSWTTPSITGVTLSDISAIWSHASRIWMIEKDTMSAWYLAADSVAGAATEYYLGSVFNKGGSLLFGATWSVSAGDGLSNKCLFVTDQGEIAVYSGTDPSSSTTWSLDGVYQMPRPLGKNAYERVAGDVWFATETSLIPLSAVLSEDSTTLERKAISQNIAPLWESQAQSIIADTWELIKIPKKSILIVSQPESVDPTRKYAFCLNTQTMGWSRISGWQTLTLTTFNGLGYFADGDGYVQLMDSGGTDNGSMYSCVYIGQYEGLGAYGYEKEATQARPLFRTGSPLNAKVSFRPDYDDTIPTPPSSPSDYTTDTWDIGLWDVALWDSAAVIRNEATWRATSGAGTVLAPVVQLTFGVTPTPVVALASIDLEYRSGAAVA